MPTEQLPWDRRDFRKHERSGWDPRFGGGGFGGGGPHRWREQHHHPHTPPHPPSFHHHNHNQQQQRWYSDFRSSRPAPSGPGKQGGWHTYSDEAGHGFPPFGSRYGDRNLEDDNFRSFGSRGEGRYFRNGRENRGSFSQKDWRSSSWEPIASSSGPGRPATVVNNQKSVENTQTCHNNNNRSNDSAQPPPDCVPDQSQSLAKEKHEKNGGNTEGPASSGHNAEKENGLGSIDWKPLKWTRSGSLSSRGSGFSHSNSSKGMGVDSIEMVAEVQPKKVTPVQSPVAACVVSRAPALSEEMSSRKKPRLGWGEGLAKYEKKKVEGPEDGATKDGLVVDVANMEPMQSPSVNLLDKSPRVANLLDCVSPATPSSVACSSSPGIDEKDSIKAATVDTDIANLISSPSIMFRTQYEGPAFNLENLDLTSIANLSSLINELVQSDDPISVETDYVRTSSMNKLLVWKVDVLKALEVTESEIDSLETVLKSLKAVLTSSVPLAECHFKPCEEQVAASTYAIGRAPLQAVSSCDMIVENRPAALKDGHVVPKDEDIDSSGSHMSKLVEELPSRMNAFPESAECIEVFVNSDLSNPCNLDQPCLENGICHEDKTCGGDDHEPFVTDCHNLDNVHCDAYDSILASNKDSAKRALEELNSLLPCKQDLFDTSVASSVSCLQKDASVIKEKFLMKKRSLRFKEKVVTLKYKVFQHFWKKGRVVSVRKLRGKSHKTFDLSRTGYKKSRSSSRSRVSYSAGSARSVPAEEVTEFVNVLLAESPFKPCRGNLKMPALILDEETKMSRFISYNGLVEDPCTAEKERSMINPWTAEEREIFIDKLAMFGKNFAKIASFLDHKTIADCIEFYYKNHKSDCFERARKKPEFAKQKKSPSTTYLVATGKRRNREVHAASLDILGEASLLAASAKDGMETQQKGTSRIFFGPAGSQKAQRGDDGSLQRSNSLDMYSNETLAADVLAGICGSLSSEAMSSCITSSVDPADGQQDWKCQRFSSCIKLPLTPDVTQNADDECSDESCEEMDPTDWTDEEKSIFIQAVSSYGKDFVKISQCVQTRSRDQCRIFFGKARKCLGLDLIQPGSCNAVSGDVNGGTSDSENACVVETGSIFCNGGSEDKMEEDLPLPNSKLSHESNVAGTGNLKPDVKTHGENSGACPLDSVSAEPVVKNLSVGDSQVDANSVIDFNSDREEHNGACGFLLEPNNKVISGNTESVRIEHGDDSGLPKGSSEADEKALVEVSDEHHVKENEGQGLKISEDDLDNNKVGDRDANSSQMTLTSSAASVQDGNVSHPVDAHSSMLVESGCQKKANLETCSAKTSHVISLPQSSHFACIESSTLFSVPIKYQTHSSSIVSSGANGICRKNKSISQTGDPQLHVSGFSPSDPVESSQILRGYPVSVQTVKETNADTIRERHVPIQHAPKQDGHLNSDHRAEFSLQKCTSSRHQSKVVQTEFPSQEPSRDHSRSQAGCSSDLDMPSRSGDVKLFGKILISSQQKPSSSVLGTGDDNGQHHKAGCQSINLKLNGDQKVNLDSSKSKFDCNNYPGSENVPIRSFCFPNGNSTQTGFPPLPDSTLLLTKYPTAFSNVSTVKLDQQQSHGVVRTNDHRLLNGVSIFPSGELSSSSNGLTDYQMLRGRELQPFNIDMKQPQDVLFSEMQRRNGLDIVSQMQQQSRGMAGINVVGRGGVLVGGQCSGISDPISAIKMHYSRAQNLSVQAGNITREDDTWRSNGDVGR